ncbi:MAG: nicotinate-nucleotide adenylyltransferase [Flavobacterium sp.]|nr:MAG: nicotinate-nucleotide adenylyltransferase [Flavobacterium sp.]
MEETFKQQPSNCLKIVLFGPESTGKTTLARELAAHFGTAWVPEYMRDYAQKKWDEQNEKVGRADLLPMAAGQMALENKRSKMASRYLFCDTDLRELKVYSQYYFDGYCPDEIRKALKINHYDLYLLTDIDTPWVADDLRDRPQDRITLFRIFENELKENNLPYALISGGKAERLKKAIELTEKLEGR